MVKDRASHIVNFDIGRAMGRLGMRLARRSVYTVARQYREQGHSVGMWELARGKEPKGTRI